MLNQNVRKWISIGTCYSMSDANKFWHVFKKKAPLGLINFGELVNSRKPRAFPNKEPGMTVISHFLLVA